MRIRAARLALSLVAVVLVFGGPSMVAPVAAATPISSCMSIIEPGSYELIQNIQATSGDCLQAWGGFITIDLKGFVIFGSSWGTGIVAGPDVAVRGGTIYGFSTGIRGSEGLVVEQMRMVGNGIGVDASIGSAVVKDSVFSNNSQSGVTISAGSVTNSTFNRNGTGVNIGFNWYGGNGVTVANNGFNQNNFGIQSQGAGASIRNNTIDGGSVALIISCPSHIMGNTVMHAGSPVMVQNNNIWDCTFEHNSIRQY